MSSINDSCEFEFILFSDSDSDSECDFDLDLYNHLPIFTINANKLGVLNEKRCNNDDDDDITDIIISLARLSLHHE